MRLGVYGGAFDPPHSAHLLLARHVLEAKALDTLIFVPTFAPPMKNRSDLAPFADRHRMVEIAIDRLAALEASDIEGKRGGVSYTIDTLRELKENYSARREDFFLVIGSDALMSFRSWHAPDEILREATVLVLRRAGFRPEDAPADLLDQVEILSNPEMDISSAGVRKRIAAGLSVKDIVPEAVIAYIEKKHLYQASGRS